MKSLSLFLTICLTSILLSVAQEADTTDVKPNIVLILVDDAGLMDFGVFGGEARTPNIDQLANGGMMFTNMHSSPVCAPSRAMLMTGSDSHLAGIANLPVMLPPEYRDKPGYRGVLDVKVQTIATRLKELNYNTYATGKWHLGHDSNSSPNQRGFDRSFVLDASGADNFEARGYLPLKTTAQWHEDGKEVDLPEDFYSSKTYVDKVIAFHEQEENRENPFFSYIAFQAIHAPIQAPKNFVDPYLTTYKEGWEKLREERFEKAKELDIIPRNTKLGDVFTPLSKWEDLSEGQKNGYVTDMAMAAGMLEAMDYHIGRYVDYLKENQQFKNTVFIITSDNGPDGAPYHENIRLIYALGLGYHRDYQEKGPRGYYGAIGPGFATALASPFDYFKYYAGEGALRVPLIMSGAQLPKGARTKEFVFFTDIAPTIYDMVGLPTAANEGYYPVTGKSILPHINDSSVSVYAKGEGVGLEAANNCMFFLDGYKIAKNNIPLGDNQWHMYNLVTDPTETTDLIPTKPELFSKILTAYRKYAEEVGVLEMPLGYSAQDEVLSNSIIAVLKHFIPHISGAFLVIISFVVLYRRLRISRRLSS